MFANCLFFIANAFLFLYQVKLSDYYSEKTEIVHKTLNPKFNSDFVVEVTHDGDILKHPLEIKYV